MNDYIFRDKVGWERCQKTAKQDWKLVREAFEADGIAYAKRAQNVKDVTIFFKYL